MLSGPAQSSSDFIRDLVTSLFLEPGFLPVSSVMPKTEGAWEYRFVGIKQPSQSVLENSDAEVVKAPN